MSVEFVSYRKFTDLESAADVADFLNKSGIESRLQDNTHAYVKFFGATEIDLTITLNLRSEDFKLADEVLQQYASQQINGIPDDYYLFSFSPEELKEIIDNPYDWGQVDLELAKKLLADRGTEYSEAYITEQRHNKVSALKIIKRVPLIKIIAGYILSVLFPILGVILALSIVYNRILLPTGEKFYLHSKQNRLHGKIMIGLSILATVVTIGKMMTR